MNEERQEEQLSRGWTSTTILSKLEPNDVLMGRGIPSIQNEGNVRFRELIGKKFSDYVKTSKRREKDCIARQVFATIINRGGRFVKKIGANSLEARRHGSPKGGWIPVDDATAILKVKQALRGRSLGEDRAAHGVENQVNRIREQANSCSSSTSSPHLQQIVADTLRRYQEQCAKAQGEISTPGPVQQNAEPQLPGSFEQVAQPWSSGAAVASAAHVDHPCTIAGRETVPEILKKAAICKRVDGESKAEAHVTTQDLLHPFPTCVRDVAGLGSQVLNPDADFDVHRQTTMSIGMPQPHLATFNTTNASTTPDWSLHRPSRRLASSVSTNQGNQTNRGLDILGDTAICIGLNEAPSATLHSSITDQSASLAGFRGERPFMANEGRRMNWAWSDLNRPPNERHHRDQTSSQQATTTEMRLLSDTSQCLEVDLVELCLLTVLCSFGLPIWVASLTDVNESKPPAFAFTWEDVARQVVEETNDFRVGKKNLSSLPALSNYRRLTSLALSAVSTANSYLKCPQDLAKIAVMLLEKLTVWGKGKDLPPYHPSSLSTCGRSRSSVVHPMDAMNEASGRKPESDILKATTKPSSHSSSSDVLLSFFQRQLGWWAASLNVDRNAIRPIPYSSEDFLVAYPMQAHHDVVTPVVALDATTCNTMLLQMACITRLRCMFQNTATEHIRCMLNVNPTTHSATNTPELGALLFPLQQASTGTASGNNNNAKNLEFLLLQSVVENGLQKGMTSKTFLLPQQAETTQMRIFQHVLHLTCSLHQQCQEMTISRVISNRGSQLRDMATALNM